MNQEEIRKMINAKFKYIIRCSYQKIQQEYIGTKDEKTEIMRVVVEKCSKYLKPMDRFSIFDQEFYCLKDVKEYIKELKNFNKFVKLQVIGL